LFDRIPLFGIFARYLWFKLCEMNYAHSHTEPEAVGFYYENTGFIQSVRNSARVLVQEGILLMFLDNWRPTSSSAQHCLSRSPSTPVMWWQLLGVTESREWLSMRRYLIVGAIAEAVGVALLFFAVLLFQGRID
jgi:hypothetical protein